MTEHIWTKHLQLHKWRAREREPIMWIWGFLASSGFYTAKPLVGGSGAKPPEWWIWQNLGKETHNIGKSLWPTKLENILPIMAYITLMFQVLLCPCRYKTCGRRVKLCDPHPIEFQTLSSRRVVRIAILLEQGRVVITTRTCSIWSTTRATRTTR